MKNDEVDDYEIKKQSAFLDESRQTIKITRENLRKKTEDLLSLIKEIEDEETKNLEEFKSAVAFLDDATNLLAQNN